MIGPSCEAAKSLIESALQGAHSPAWEMTPAEALEVAHRLDDLRVETWGGWCRGWRGECPEGCAAFVSPITDDRGFPSESELHAGYALAILGRIFAQWCIDHCEVGHRTVSS